QTVISVSIRGGPLKGKTAGTIAMANGVGVPQWSAWHYRSKPECLGYSIGLSLLSRTREREIMKEIEGDLDFF
ncbi:unnamed protein product, partial [Dovyalis caffra]